MSARRDDRLETDAPGAMEKLGARVRQRALTGAEASTVGFILVAYIAVFAGLGYWLDTIFKTSWLVAVGVFAGAAIGFREMFRIAQKLNRQSIAQDDEAERAALQSTRAQSVHKPSTPDTRPSLFADTATQYASTQFSPDTFSPDTSSAADEETRARPRLFAVPPPPTASFEKPSPSQNQSVEDATDESPDDTQEVIERLLEDKENEVK